MRYESVIKARLSRHEASVLRRISSNRHSSKGLLKNIVAVANKVKNADDEASIRQFCAQTDLPVIAVIPLDPTVSEADKSGSLNMRDIDSSPALKAISALADTLLETAMA